MMYVKNPEKSAMTASTSSVISQEKMRLTLLTAIMTICTK